VVFDSITLTPTEYIEAFFVEKGQLLINEKNLTELEARLTELTDRIKYYGDFPMEFLPVITELKVLAEAIRKERPALELPQDPERSDVYSPDATETDDDDFICGAV
jgi:hypothetical protein